MSKTAKVIIIVACVLVILSFLFIGILGGYGIYRYIREELLYGDSKTFNYSYNYNVMSIDLTENFEQSKEEGFVTVMTSDDVKVYVTCERDELRFPDYYNSLEGYAKLVISNNHLGDTEIYTKDDLTYFNYISGDCYYYAFVYEYEDDFWMIQFEVSEENRAKYHYLILDWAKSVSFE